jgi:hypothetical protein
MADRGNGAADLCARLLALRRELLDRLASVDKFEPGYLSVLADECHRAQRSAHR